MKGGNFKMQKISGWLFLLIALTWLLPLLGVTLGNMDVHQWIATIALVIIGIMELKK